MGSLAAGGAATIGTGAFTSVEAERSVSVDVAGDQSAYLALEPTSHPNSKYARINNNNLEVVLDGTDTDGDGFNTNAVTEMDKVFRVSNQGTQPIYFWVEHPSGTGDDVFLDPENFWFYPDGSPGKKIHDGSEEVLTLTPGESATLGVKADFTSGDVGSGDSFDAPVTFYASANKRGVGDGSNTVDAGGNQVLVVRKDSSTDYSTIQDAVDAASEGATIQVDAGTYEEFVKIKDTAGLTIQGDGPGQTVVINGFKFEDHVTDDAGLTVQDMTMKGVAASGRTLYTVGSTTLTVSNVHFNGTGNAEYAMYSNGVTASTVTDCEYKNYTTSRDPPYYLAN
mgnify:FL=1